jgi:hypothetical protein
MAVMAGLLLWLRHLGTPPRERSLLETFHQHRHRYERLAVLMRADPTLHGVIRRSRSVHRGDGWFQDVAPADTSYDEYFRLLEEARAARVDRRRRDPGVCIALWGWGWAGEGRRLAVCSLECPPNRQVASLDEFHRSPMPHEPAYRHIEGDWYLWADW